MYVTSHIMRNNYFETARAMSDILKHLGRQSRVLEEATEYIDDYKQGVSEICRGAL